MTSNDNIFNNNEFKAILLKYQSVQDDGGATFFDVDDILDVAEYFNSKGDTESARKAALYAAKLYPHSAAVLSLLARIALFNDNDVAKAKRYVSEIEDHYDLEYFYINAEIMIAQDEIHEADSYLESKMSMLEGDDLADFVLEVPALFIDYNVPELAQKWLSRSDETDCADYKELQGRIAYLNGDYETSEKIFKQLLEDEPFSATLWNSLSNAQYMRTHILDSIESCEFAIAVDPDNKEALVNKANALTSLERYKEAAEFYNRYLASNPHDAHIRLLYSVALIGMRSYEEALAQLSTARTDCTDKTLRADIIKEIACLMPKMAKGEEAIVFLDASEQSGEISHTDKLLTEGYIYLDLGFTNHANDRFVEALINSKYSKDTYLQVALAYFDAGDNEKVVSILSHHIDSEATPPRGYAYLACACFKLGMQQEFIEALKKACQLNPHEAQNVMGYLFPPKCTPDEYVEYASKNLMHM